MLDEGIRILDLPISQDASIPELRRHLRHCEFSQPLPVDFILAPAATPALIEAAKHEAIPLFIQP
jgi:hypothetical protein